MQPNPHTSPMLCHAFRSEAPATVQPCPDCPDVEVCVAQAGEFGPCKHAVERARVPTIPADDIALALRAAGCSPVIASDEAGNVRASHAFDSTITCTRVGAEWRVRGRQLDAVISMPAQLEALPDLVRAVIGASCVSVGAVFAAPAA